MKNKTNLIMAIHRSILNTSPCRRYTTLILLLVGLVVFIIYSDLLPRLTQYHMTQQRVAKQNEQLNQLIKLKSQQPTTQQDISSPPTISINQLLQKIIKQANQHHLMIIDLQPLLSASQSTQHLQLMTAGQYHNLRLFILALSQQRDKSLIKQYQLTMQRTCCQLKLVLTNHD